MTGASGPLFFGAAGHSLLGVGTPPKRDRNPGGQGHVLLRQKTPRQGQEERQNNHLQATVIWHPLPKKDMSCYCLPWMSPTLQYTDAIGRSLGQQFTNLQLSGSAAGPIQFDKAF